MVESTDFSDFIRNASIEQKESVYLMVIDRAIERQKMAGRSLNRQWVITQH